MIADLHKLMRSHSDYEKLLEWLKIWLNKDWKQAQNFGIYSIYTKKNTKPRALCKWDYIVD